MRTPLTVIHGSIDQVSVMPCSSVTPVECQRRQTSRLCILVKALNDQHVMGHTLTAVALPRLHPLTPTGIAVKITVCVWGV